VLTVLVAASGVTGDAHGSECDIQGQGKRRADFFLIRTRAASLGLVAAFGFMLVVSLAASTALSALGHFFKGLFAGKILLAVLNTVNTVVSLAIFTVLFTPIYKVLPDTTIFRRDLVLGAFVTGVLSTIGKALIGIDLVAQRLVRPMARLVPSSGRLFRADLPVRRRVDQGHRR
jgi:membrane protein